MCIIYSVISGIKFASGKELERNLGILSVISSIKFARGKDLERNLGRHRPVARTSLFSVPDWRLPVCKNARVTGYNPGTET